MYISATALCAFGMTGLDNFAFRLLLFDSFAFLLNRGPPDPHGQVPSPLWAALENHCFRYMSSLIFTTSLSGSII